MDRVDGGKVPTITRMTYARRQEDFLAAQELQGLQGFFLAAHGLHGLQAFFFAAQGLQAPQPPRALFLAAQGL